MPDELLWKVAEEVLRTVAEELLRTPPPRRWGRPPPPQQESPSQVVQSTVRWLRRNVPAVLWDRFHEKLVEINLDYREELKVINARLGLKAKKSYLKHMSYCGAVRVPADHDGQVSYYCHIHNRAYLDVGNHNYCSILRYVWPTATAAGYSDETAGDLVEAVLGLHWAHHVHGNRALCDAAENFVHVLEMGLLAWAACTVTV